MPALWAVSHVLIPESGLFQRPPLSSELGSGSGLVCVYLTRWQWLWLAWFCQYLCVCMCMCVCWGGCCRCKHLSHGTRTGMGTEGGPFLLFYMHHPFRLVHGLIHQDHLARHQHLLSPPHINHILELRRGVLLHFPMLFC